MGGATEVVGGGPGGGGAAGTGRLAQVVDDEEGQAGPASDDGQEAQEVASASDGSVTVLTLNRLGPETTPPAGFFQFALSPEDEAEAAADRVLADGYYRGVALVPASSWGDRLLAAFANRLRGQR